MTNESQLDEQRNAKISQLESQVQHWKSEASKYGLNALRKTAFALAPTLACIIGSYIATNTPQEMIDFTLDSLLLTSPINLYCLYKNFVGETRGYMPNYYLPVSNELSLRREMLEFYKEDSDELAKLKGKNN